MSASIKHLFVDFSTKTKAEWLTKIEKDLKGGALDALTWRDIAPLSIEPFAHADDFDYTPEALKNEAAAWEIGEDFDIKDPKKDNATVREALMSGTNAPHLAFDTLPSVEEWSAVTEGIDFEYITTWISEKTQNQNPLKMLKNWAENTKNAQILRGGVFFDPFADGRAEVKATQELLAWQSENMPELKVITVGGGQFFKGSENTVDELTAILLAGEKYLRRLTEAGTASEIVAKAMAFEVHIGISYFVEIAKLRALRLLWANVLEAYDVNDNQCFIHAKIDNDTQVADVHTNKIRATTQAMSAVIGGADRLTVSPSSDDALGRRMARNVQHLLQLESYLDRVADPAAGSFYIEKLTDSLCEAVWEKFQAAF